MNGPPSARNPTYLDSPPPPRKVLSRPVVKVVIPEPGSAEITDEKGTIHMTASTEMVLKRFYPGESVVYFKSELYEDGILEIGDRVPTPSPVW